MPIQVYWDNEQHTILYTKFVGNWTWEDYHTSLNESVKLTNGIDHRFDHIIDMRQSHYLPPSSALNHILRGRSMDNPQKRLTIIVDAPVLIKSLVTVFDRAFGKRYKQRIMVETIEQAYKVIHERHLEATSVES